MLLDIDGWIYGRLNANSTLTGKLHYFYPNSFNSLPVVAYSTNQTVSDMDYQDDVNNYMDAVVSLDVYVKNDTNEFSICQAIDTVLTGLMFSLVTSIPVPDPDAKTQHRHLEYQRRGISMADLI